MSEEIMRLCAEFGTSFNYMTDTPNFKKFCYVIITKEPFLDSESIYHVSDLNNYIGITTSDGIDVRKVWRVRKKHDHKLKHLFSEIMPDGFQATAENMLGDFIKQYTGEDAIHTIIHAANIRTKGVKKWFVRRLPDLAISPPYDSEEEAQEALDSGEIKWEF